MYDAKLLSKGSKIAVDFESYSTSPDYLCIDQAEVCTAKKMLSEMVLNASFETDDNGHYLSVNPLVDEIDKMDGIEIEFKIKLMSATD